MTPAPGPFKYIILGAGAAGLSLCCHLLERGIRDPILILDGKAAFADDRTWCFWDVHPTLFSDLAAQCWHEWEVFDTDARAATQAAPGVGYFCLRSADFYARAFAAIRCHPNVTLRLGCPAGGCRTLDDRAEVQAGGETFAAEHVFDSRPPALPGGNADLTQRFFGQFVRAAQPCFDPACCTLMDFRCPQVHGLHFFYLLPFSPTEALVENTYVHSSRLPAPTPSRHRAEIAAYLALRYGPARFEVAREEAGAIPMTARPFPKRDGRVFFIGTAGGCTKPSSGYTFARIQEQCRQLAEAAAEGRLARFQERLPPARFRFFDAVFLQALRDHPGAFPGYFQRLFARVPPEALTAFLSETSTWRSDIHILRSLPPAPFLTAAVRSLFSGRKPPRGCGPG